MRKQPYRQTHPHRTNARDVRLDNFVFRGCDGGLADGGGGRTPAREAGHVCTMRFPKRFPDAMRRAVPLRRAGTAPGKRPRRCPSCPQRHPVDQAGRVHAGPVQYARVPPDGDFAGKYPPAGGRNRNGDTRPQRLAPPRAARVFRDGGAGHRRQSRNDDFLRVRADESFPVCPRKGMRIPDGSRTWRTAASMSCAARDFGPVRCISP